MCYLINNSRVLFNFFYIRKNDEGTLWAIELLVSVFWQCTAFYIGKLSMQFVEGAPQFAVEVRSEGDYGPVADKELAEKRADYFAAGTTVVWDVDLLSEEVVRSYSVKYPTDPTLFRRGDSATAEPAVRLAVTMRYETGEFLRMSLSCFFPLTL